MMPVVDIVEVGTGGGSIAWIDEVGALKVGPRSAGADPGPICYRAAASSHRHHRILGRIGTDSF
jgi:N-methylhydantoinase A